MDKPVILMLCNNAHNQIALANKMHTLLGIDHIIVENKITKRKLSLQNIWNKLRYKTIDDAWFNMLSFYKNKFPAFPATNVSFTIDINSAETESIIKTLKPDLILVSGTRIIKNNIIGINPPLGIMNMHTGLSPFVNGGPNCTNWCIALNKFHLIGNTIMWLDAGIDSGNIIATSQVDFTGNETLTDVQIKVMEHAHQLYIDAAKAVIANKNSVNNIPQKSISTGNTYYTKMWTSKQKKDLLQNFKHFANAIKSESYLQNKNKIKTIPL
ncbi:MAG: hypothetical protein IPP29_20615 [Bacteroidetes bacterium]|nr:hypothetical protein [Bacteroidota bacterium]